jgi:hypothetical protein
MLRAAGIALASVTLVIAGSSIGGTTSHVDTDRHLADRLYGDEFGPCPEGEAGPTLQWEDTSDQYQIVVERAQLATITVPIDEIDNVNVTLPDGRVAICALGTKGLVWTGASYFIALDNGEIANRLALTPMQPQPHRTRSSRP